MLVKKNYKPKLLAIVLVFFCLYIVILFRLFLIQIYQKEFFKVLAKQQYVTEITTHPPRALIYDRNKEPFALNSERLSAFILPHRFHEPEKTKNILKKDFTNIYNRFLKDKKRRFLWLERHLYDERLKKIKSYNSKDIYFLAEPERFYPFLSAAHLIGFTDVDNVGIAGIELQFDKRIGGVSSTFTLEKDARSGYFYFKKGVKKRGYVGKPVKLTIDKNLQFFAFEELENTIKEHNAKSGAVLIIEPYSGEILTMASFPGFDPNKIPITETEKTRNILATDCFELGSVVKALTALVALEEEVVTPDEEIDCEGKSTYIDGFRVENWKSLGPGLHPFSEVVAKSNNVGIAKIAKRLGPKLYHHFRRLGFGRKTGIRFPGERDGFINPPRSWSNSSLIVLSFGYEMMATLLQLGKAFCIIANGGNDVNPVLVSKPMKKTYSLGGQRLYSQDVVDQLKNILELKDWAKDLYGIEGYRIVGKTGTARRVKDKKYSKKSHIYTYAGIVEKKMIHDEKSCVKDYKRVIITFVKEPKKSHLWASQVALPLFHRVAKKMIVYDLGKSF